jgi:hypothetical protein
MAIAEAYTNTATIGATPYSLPNNSTTPASITTDGVYQAFIDFTNLTVTETYDIQIKEKVTSGGTQRLVWEARVQGTQTAAAFVTPSLLLMHGWDILVYKVAGTDRSIDWSIRQVA